MKQVEYYPSFNGYRVWDEDGDKRFVTWTQCRNYLVQLKETVKSKTLGHTERRSLAKSGVKLHYIGE